MLFNSLEFLVFFRGGHAAVLPAAAPLPLAAAAASCAFYMAFIPAYILILLLTIAIDYGAGILIEPARGPSASYLAMSLAANVGVLAVFKYYNFFADNVNALLQLSQGCAYAAAAQHHPAHWPVVSHLPGHELHH
jgi:alginate O-acetyltransferase complex protein AlgI